MDDAYQALSFILNGGTYFPTVTVQSLETGRKQADNSHNGLRSESESKNQKDGTNGVGSADSGYRSANFTSRQREVLDHVRRGESNKLIARHLGMTEGTVKVHIRQMMRKFQVSNRTQLAVDRAALATESSSSFDTRSQNGDGSATRRQQTLPFVSPATRYRSRVDGKH
jgi:DNA-binding NarL/FixJ family response regulator